MLSVIAEHIEMTREICEGEPHIAGSTIKVRDVVIWHEKMALSPRQIVSRYPMLSLSDVHAALAYYYDRQAEIERQIADRVAEFPQTSIVPQLTKKEWLASLRRLRDSFCYSGEPLSVTVIKARQEERY